MDNSQTIWPQSFDEGHKKLINRQIDVLHGLQYHFWLISHMFMCVLGFPGINLGLWVVLPDDIPTMNPLLISFCPWPQSYKFNPLPPSHTDWEIVWCLWPFSTYDYHQSSERIRAKSGIDQLIYRLSHRYATSDTNKQWYAMIISRLQKV